MSTLRRVLVYCRQETCFMIIEEQNDLLFIAEACLDAITGQLTYGCALVIVILLEGEWLLESQMGLNLMCSVICKRSLYLVKLH
jgi:hypothetical protein